MELVTLYHYTTLQGFQGIQATRIINMANQHNTIFGPGVYFSDKLVDHNNITQLDMGILNYGPSKSVENFKV